MFWRGIRVRNRQLKPLQDRLKKVEQKLEAIMQEKQTVETKLADSDLYQEDRKKDLMEALDRQKELAWKEGDLMKEWDLLSEQIEGI